MPLDIYINCSNPGELLSIVPQGHLNPLLFCLFINSITNHLNLDKVKNLLFADDVTFFTKIYSLLDHQILQAELHISIHWVTRVGLTLNLNKC